ncbi:SMC-Scp complex subunit ScpB [Methylomonas sp. UP202]|uniref:SMC-Scp complex subunit ScpB n=1 Tax=Methylomonas sp. UP202 TaxID=3040943 RepID=UPI0032AF555D
MRFPRGWSVERHAGIAARTEAIANVEPVEPAAIDADVSRGFRPSKARLAAGRRGDWQGPVSASRSVGRHKSSTRLLPSRRGDWRMPRPAAPAVSPRKRVPRLPLALADGWRVAVTERSEPRPAVFDYPLEANVNTKRIVEAILFAANRPMTVKQIQETFPELEQPDTLAIQIALEEIARDYADRPVGLKHLASGYRFQVREGLAHWVGRLFEERPARYSRALLETLAIIAYRQPVTRGEIEDIRGVSVSTSIVQTLLEREWVKVVGHKEVPGRPALYCTTKQFLDYFNLTSLSELPPLEEIVEMDLGPSAQPPAPQEPRERPQTEQTPVGEGPTAQAQNQPSEAESDEARLDETRSGDTPERTLH